jgi:hypothetical protein
MEPNIVVATSKARLPETLPEFPRVDTASEFEALAMLDASNRDVEVPQEGESSGVQPVGQAWEDVHQQMKRAFAIGDYDRALMLGERFLRHDDKDVIALLCVEECRVMVEAQLTELLFPLDRVVVPRLRVEDLANAHVDARGAFLFTRVDGNTTLEDLLDIAGMPRVDALRYLADWVEQGYVAYC